MSRDRFEPSPELERSAPREGGSSERSAAPEPPAPEPAAPEPAAPVSRRSAAIGLCALVTAIAFESIAVATAMPVAARDLAGLQIYAWAFSMFLIGMLFATVLTGRSSDRIGPARPLVLGIVTFAIGLLVAGTAEHMLVLIAGRLIQGLGGGAMNTAAYVVIAQVFNAAQRPRVFTYISTAWVLPAFVGPPIAAWITAQLSWHWVFIAVLPLVGFGTVMLISTLRGLGRAEQNPGLPTGSQQADSRQASSEQASSEQTSSEQTSFEQTSSEQTSSRQPPAPLWAAGLAASAAAAIQYAGQRLDWWSLLPLVLGLAALGVSLPRLMPPGFFRLSRGLVSVIMSRLLLPGSFFGAEAFVPLMLNEQRGVSLVFAGAMLTAGSAGWTIAAWLQSQEWFRVRRERLISLGCVLVFGGVSLVAVIAAVPSLWVGLVAVGWILAGLGMGFATSSTSLAVMTLSAPSDVGRNAASLNLGDALGSSVFVGLTGTIFAALHPGGQLALTFGAAIGAAAVIGVLAVLASLRIGPVTECAHR